MNLVYQQAAIDFCLDLTDPKSKSVPIAALLVGKVGEDWVAAAASFEPRTGFDPISRAVLGDVPHLIRRHLDSTVASLKQGATADELLHAFHQALRNTLHVAKIEAPREIEVSSSDARQVLAKAMELAFEALVERLPPSEVTLVLEPKLRRLSSEAGNAWVLPRASGAERSATV